jgi:hypothetical protein
MSVDNTTRLQDEDIQEVPVDHTERDYIEDLILQNKTLDALIKGLTADIETFKTSNDGNPSAPDIVRFTMQLNIMKDKKARNLAE